MPIIEVPIEILEIPPFGVHCLIKARIGDQQINLVVDTGASRTVIDSTFMEDVYGPEALVETMEPSAAIGVNNLPSFYITIPSMRIGEMLFESYDAVAMDLSNIIESYEMMGLPEIKGILGGDVLLHAQSIIDYGRAMLVMNTNDGIIER